MLQSGTSRQLLELWAPDARNAIIITGSSVEGTLARVSGFSLFVKSQHRLCIIANAKYTVSCPSRVVVASPWNRVTLIVSGFGLLARNQQADTALQDIIKSPDSITSLRGTEILCRLSVHDISFSAHVDYAQNAEFIELVKAPHVVRMSPSLCSPCPYCVEQVLVHGQQDNMRRLRDAMEKRFRSRGEDVRVHTPRNLEVVRLEFPQERIAKVEGPLLALHLLTASTGIGKFCR